MIMKIILFIGSCLWSWLNSIFFLFQKIIAEINLQGKIATGISDGGRKEKAMIRRTTGRSGTIQDEKATTTTGGNSGTAMGTRGITSEDIGTRAGMAAGGRVPRTSGTTGNSRMMAGLGATNGTTGIRRMTGIKTKGKNTTDQGISTSQV